MTQRPLLGDPTGDSATSIDAAPQRRVAWHLDFARRAGRHGGVVPPSLGELSRMDRHVLAGSLATFQVGESGTGEHLLAAAAEAETTDRYRDALAMFVVEEQEHARLLALVIEAIDHPLKPNHWTDRVFVFLRRIKSLRSEVLTLLVAELIALTYYSALRDGLPEAREVFGRIHEDEVRHVEFHADTLPTHIARWRPSVQMAVRILWNVLVTGASVVVAVDHRRAMRMVGVRVPTFVARVWRDRRDLDRRLFA